MRVMKNKPAMAGVVCEAVPEFEPGELVNYRKKLGLSQSELATKLGISVRLIENWEQGVCEPSGSSYSLLRMFFGSRNFAGAK